MKKLPVGVWIALVLIVGAGLGWWGHRNMTQAAPIKPALAQPSAVAQAPALVNRSAPNSPTTRYAPPPPAVVTSQDQWREYTLARQKVLQQNPELAAEYEELRAEVEAQQQKLEAAMMRADPKAAPIIAKFHAMRQRSKDLADASIPKAAPSSHPDALTPGEWQELRWPRLDRTATAAAAGSWKPIYARLLQTLGWIDAQGQRSGALKAYTRIGMPGTVAAFEPEMTEEPKVDR